MSNEVEKLKQKIEAQEIKIKPMELDVDKLRCLGSAGFSDVWDLKLLKSLNG